MYQNYKVFSCDSHVFEPVDLYHQRIEERFKPRLPHEVEADGVKWRMTEGHAPSRLKKPPMEGLDAVRDEAGGFIGEKRREDLRKDGVDLSVCYPNRAFSLLATNDGEFQLAIARVFNDWILETDLARMSDDFVLSAILPPKDVVRARAELVRIANSGKFKGLFMPSWIEGQPYAGSSIYDPLWATIEEIGLPVLFHAGVGIDPRTARGDGGAIINYVRAITICSEPVLQLCSSGILERFPKIKFALIESQMSWLPGILHLMDEGYHKHHMWVRPKLPMLPSDYFRRQGHVMWMDDEPGLQMREYIGMDSILWGDDYPHHEGTWPNSAEVFDRSLSGLSDDDKRKLLWDNAARLFNVDPTTHEPAPAGASLPADR